MRDKHSQCNVCEVACLRKPSNIISRNCGVTLRRSLQAVNRFLAVRLSETSVSIYQATQRYFPEDSHLHIVQLVTSAE
jgi:hypothetical protein